METSGGGEHFRQVWRVRRGFALVIQHAFDLHEATGVIGNDIVRAGLGDGGAFDFAHGGGNHGEFHGEGAAETAAGFAIVEFNQLQAAHVLEELARLFFNAEFAQAVAAVVEGGAAFKARADIGEAKLVDEEIGEFKGARGQSFGGGFLRVAVEKFGVEDFHHGPAGTGGADDDFGVAEDGDVAAGDLTGFVPITGIEGGLATAGLALRIIHLMAEPLEKPHHAHGDLGVELIHKAGDEQADFHGHGC